MHHRVRDGELPLDELIGRVEGSRVEVPVGAAGIHERSVRRERPFEGAAGHGDVEHDRPVGNGDADELAVGAAEVDGVARDDRIGRDAAADVERKEGLSGIDLRADDRRSRSFGEGEDGVAVDDRRA